MSTKIYRYKFSPKFINQLEYFANVHKYEDRVGFKEKWEEWVEENEEIVEEERDRLIELGYDGDVDNKMFTSARYYFRKKQPKSEPKKRKTYMTISKTILEIIDEHITNNYLKDDYTQKDGFEDFYEQNEDLIKYEIHIDKQDVLKQKIKKTYKNRYFRIVKQLKFEEDDEEFEEVNKFEEDIEIIIE